MEITSHHIATPSVDELHENREQFRTGDVDEHARARGFSGGTFGYHKDLADLYVERGAFYQNEWYEVTSAVITGSEDGEFTGEATLKHTPYEEPEVVDFKELELPSKAGLRYAKEHITSRTERTEVPGYYQQEISSKEHIARSANAHIYVSAKKKEWGWPWKLMSYYEVSPTAAQSAGQIMIDSGHNRWGSPEDVLDAAAKVDADYVMTTDVCGMEDPYTCPVTHCSERFDEPEAARRHITESEGRHEGQYGSDYDHDDLLTRGHNTDMPSTDDPGIETEMDAAMEGIRRFMERAEELEIMDRVILTLQPPFDEFLDRVEAETDWLDRVDYVAMGGMLAINDVEDRIEAIHTVRERVGDDMRIHGLSPGTEKEMLYEIQQNPDLLDSMDVGTPEQAPTKHTLVDADRNRHRHSMSAGPRVSGVMGQYTSGQVVQLAHQISPLCNVEKVYGDLHDPDHEEYYASESEPATEGPAGDDEDTRQQRISAWARSGENDDPEPDPEAAD